MRNGIIEQILTDHPDLVWEYRAEVPLESIDRKESLKNQARISDPLITEKVNEYAEAMKNGNEFPAIVCYEYSNDSLVNIDGNHRTEAHLRAKHETCDAYVVLTEDPLERILLTYECNTANGIPTTEDDRVAQGINLFHQGFAVSDIAEHLHIRAPRIYEGIADYNGQLRARGLGVQNPWSKIESRTSRVRLQNGLVLDKVFSLAVQYVSEFQISAGETKKLIAGIKENASESDQLGFIRSLITLAEKMREEGRDKRGQFLLVPANQVFAHASYWSKVDALSIVQAMTADERKKLKPQVVTAVENLKKVLVAVS